MISGQVTPRGARRVGAAFLLGAAALTLSLVDVRARTTLPNVVWFLVLVVLLAAGGAATAWGLATRAPAARRRLAARVLLVAGAVGLGFGGVAAGGPGAPWAAETRALAALGFVAAFAILPAGAVLAWHAARDVTTSAAGSLPQGR